MPLIGVAVLGLLLVVDAELLWAWCTERLSDRAFATSALATLPVALATGMVLSASSCSSV
jgi:hypothetical protein